MKEEKKCNRCKEKKPISDFSKNTNFKDNIHITCKKCIAKRVAELKRKKLGKQAEDKTDPLKSAKAQVKLLNEKRDRLGTEIFIEVHTEDVERVIVQVASYTWNNGHSKEADALKETCWNMINVSERDLIKTSEYAKNYYKENKAS